MDGKAKNLLPNTYEQYLAIKKKQGRLLTTHNGPKSGHLVLNDQANQQKQRMQQDTQQDITYGQIKEVIVHSDYQTMINQFNNSKFDAIKSKIESQMQKLKDKNPIQVLRVNVMMKNLNIQSFENLQALQIELKKPVGKRNVQQIDNMLSFNKFFTLLSRDKRYKIYDHCHLLIVQDGQTIYKEGQLDDYMYIILKGSVKQYENKQTSFNQKVNANFITHYQGSNFGQSLLINDSNSRSKRYNVTVAVEKTYLMLIQNNFYRQLIINSKEDDFEKKITSLLSTSIFKDTSKIFIIPLLSVIQKHILDYGKVLIRQGQPVRKMYFVAEGSLQLVYIQRSKRTVKHMNIQQKPPNFYLKRPNSKTQQNRNYSIHKSFYYPKDSEGFNKEFMYGGKKIVGDQLEYNDHISFAELKVGDFLGGKCFLSQSDIETKIKKQPNFNPNIQSKLTVLSSSISTIVYSLDQKKFVNLSDNLQKLIIEGIMATPYFDQQPIQQKSLLHKQWKKYSQSLVKSIITEKKQKVHSFRD